MFGMYYQDKNGKCHDIDEYINNIKIYLKEINEKSILKKQWLSEIEQNRIKGVNKND